MLAALLLTLAASPDAGVAQPIRYLALGDSFTIGTSQPEALNYPSQLTALLRKKGFTVRTENVAVNGYSTKEVIEHELPALDVVKPTLVTLAIGANDLVREKNPTVYRKRLHDIFARVAATKARMLVLPQPDWSQAPISDGFGPRDVLQAKIEAYNAILADEARQVGATYIDCWALMKEQGAAQLFASDGLHPLAKAYTAWAQLLFEEVVAK